MAISKKLTKQLNDVEKLIVKEGEKWLDIVMCSTIIVMWRYYGWRTDRISKLIKYHEAVWNEVGADNSKSVLKLTPYQWLYMRTNQIKWLETQITGSIALAIHRKEGWGLKRIKELLIHLQDVKEEFDYDRRRLLDACFRETGYDWEGRTLEEDQEAT